MYVLTCYTIYSYCALIGAVNHYYLGFYLNFKPTESNISILLLTTERYQVQYSIEAPSVSYYHNGTVSAGNEVILSLNGTIEVTSHNDQNKGIYLTTSSDKVSVIGQNLYNYTSESFLVSPITELNDTDYVYYGISTTKFADDVYFFNSSILVVGTENNTAMKLTVTQYVNVSVGNATKDQKLTPGWEYLFVINRLQTVYIRSLEDLTGTKIITDRPVSVLSGHECGNVPWNISYCNHLIEQIPPTTLWGKVYYTAPLTNRTSYTIKILAAYNSTIVNIHCNNTRKVYTINEGGFVNVTSSMQEYCAIYSNKKLLVAQFSHGASEDNEYGDPMMLLVPPTDQYSNKFGFSTIRNTWQSGYNHNINIIVMSQYYQPNMIYLIAGGVNRSLLTQQWVPIKVNSITEAHATHVNIPEGVTEIFHSDPAAQLMVIVYGFSRHNAYGHIGGIFSSTAAG